MNKPYFVHSFRSAFAAAMAFSALMALTGCGSSKTQLNSSPSKSGSTSLSPDSGGVTTTGGGITTPTSDGGSGSDTAVTVAKPWTSARSAGGSEHSCVIGRDGAVWCRGSNDYGQLGNGSISSTDAATTSFSKVQGLPAGIQMIAAGNDFTCALDLSGGAWCWGDNRYGQLGDGTTTVRGSAARVSSLSSGVTGLAAGSNHVCAILSGGAVNCWGANRDGQLGDGTTTDRAAPVAVGDGFTGGAQAIAVGGNHSCATDGNGALLCWGSNYYYELGDGTASMRTQPVAVSGMSRGVQAIAAGAIHTCALKDGALYCWGYNNSGQLGNGSYAPSTQPAPVLSPGFAVTSLVASYLQTCVTGTGSRVACWGQVWSTDTAASAPSSEVAPRLIQGLAGNVRELDLGGFHACAFDDAGLQCWGSAPYDALKSMSLPGPLVSKNSVLSAGSARL
jgi:hypothetical protein